MTTEDASVSDRFHEIDQAALEKLGSRTVDQIMIDIHDQKLSLYAVSVRNLVSMGDVVQVARFHKIDPITLESYE